jgi:hypothetical protein
MKCLNCPIEDSTVMEVRPGKWLCKKCRGILRRARRKAAQQESFKSYHDALTKPQYRGLRGARK